MPSRDSRDPINHCITDVERGLFGESDPPPAYWRFAAAFLALVRRYPNEAPSPMNLNARIGRYPINVLNGRESRWRIALLEDAGFTKNEETGRWMPPRRIELS